MAFAEKATQSIESKIKSDAIGELMSHARSESWLNTDARVSVWLPEQWLEANTCNSNIAIERGRSMKPWGRVSYEISCSDPAWKTRGRADVDVETQMVVANGSLQRGSTITEKDIRVEQKSLDRVYSEILSRPSEAIGKRVLRSVRAGSIVPERSIAKPFLVEKGAPLVIEVNSMGIEASMKGTALENGSLNERVSVRNESSGKTVSGMVVGRNKVRTFF